MKKYILIVAGIIIASLAFCGCKTGVFTTEGGKEDVGYLQIFSSGDLANQNVSVLIDNTTKFDAKVIKAKQSTEKHNGQTYGIKTGTRHVRIQYKGNTIYEKDIFITSRQTKSIIL